MNTALDLIITTLLLVGGVSIYIWADHADPTQQPMIVSMFFFYFGLLVLASYYWWKRIFLLRVIKIIFSDFSFPRGVKWLPWWGAFIILLASGRAVVWIVYK